MLVNWNVEYLLGFTAAELNTAFFPVDITKGEGNTALDEAMSADAGFAASMEELGISVPKSSTGSIIGKSPENWVWHHDTEAGIMQLVPKSQHPNIPGGIFWETMHPGGVGGFSIWGQ